MKTFPDLTPQFPLYKEKAVNKTDHNGILTFTPRSGAEFKFHADKRLPVIQKFRKYCLLVPMFFTLLFSLPLLINQPLVKLFQPCPVPCLGNRRNRIIMSRSICKVNQVPYKLTNIHPQEETLKITSELKSWISHLLKIQLLGKLCSY